MLNYPVQEADASWGSLAPGQGYHDLMGLVVYQKQCMGTNPDPQVSSRAVQPVETQSSALWVPRLTSLQEGAVTPHALPTTIPNPQVWTTLSEGWSLCGKKKKVLIKLVQLMHKMKGDFHFERTQALQMILLVTKQEKQ